jgi:arylsulfatase
VILSLGGNDGGFSLYVQDGKLRYAYNYVGRNRYYVESNRPVPAGRHALRFEFEVTGQPDIPRGKGAPGRGQLYIDGTLVGQADIPLTNPLNIGLLASLVCGADVGAPVTPTYKSPFPFTGTIHRVTVDVSGELIRDTEAELRIAMARQ